MLASYGPIHGTDSPTRRGTRGRAGSAHDHVTGRSRLGLGPTRDVVVVDAVLEATVPVLEAEAGLIDAYAAQADGDPRAAGPSYVFLVLRPGRIQAWREVARWPGARCCATGSGSADPGPGSTGSQGPAGRDAHPPGHDRARFAT